MVLGLTLRSANIGSAGASARYSRASLASSSSPGISFEFPYKIVSYELDWPLGSFSVRIFLRGWFFEPRVMPVLS